MAEEPYLLTLEESAGEDTFITKHIIKTENRQKVKYHFHRTMKDWGYTDTQFGKHCLQSGYLHCEIFSIDSLTDEEYNILDRFLPSWYKV